MCPVLDDVADPDKACNERRRSGLMAMLLCIQKAPMFCLQSALHGHERKRKQHIALMLCEAGGQLRSCNAKATRNRCGAPLPPPPTRDKQAPSAHDESCACNPGHRMAHTTDTHLPSAHKSTMQIKPSMAPGILYKSLSPRTRYTNPHALATDFECIGRLPAIPL